MAIIYFCIYFIFLILYGYKGIRQLKVQYANLIFKDKKLFNDLAIDDIKDINNIKFSPEKEKIDRKDFRRRTTSKSLRRLSKKNYILIWIKKNY